MAPARIVLMRHAEKPPREDDSHLSEAGRRRAERLAVSLPGNLGRPDVLFAASDKPGSFRPRETLEPLAAAIGLDIRQFSDKLSDAFAEKLLGDPEFEGKQIIVAWRHDALPALARALGAPKGLCPDPWPAGLYDLILRFDYGPGCAAQVAAVTAPP
jgi:broad specificity phosphatase PhoE